MDDGDKIITCPVVRQIFDYLTCYEAQIYNSNFDLIKFISIDCQRFRILQPMLVKIFQIPATTTSNERGNKYAR